MHTIAAKAVAFKEALDSSFKEYQQRVVSNARVLAEVLIKNGVRVVSGGTDTHMVLVDLTPIGVTGKDAEEALGRVNITVNKNAIPFDTLPASVASGLRLGTPSITSRGFQQSDTEQIASLISRTITHIGDERREAEIRTEVLNMTSKFPVPGLQSTGV